MHAPILYLTHSGLLLSKKLYFFHLSACFLALSYVTKKKLKPDIKSHELWLASKGLLSTSSSEICKCNLRISSCRVSSNFEALHLKNLNTNCLRWLFIVFSRLTHVYSSLERSEDDRSFHLFKRIYDGKNLVSMHSTFTTFPYAWKKKKQATAILTSYHQKGFFSEYNRNTYLQMKIFWRKSPMGRYVKNSAFFWYDYPY